MIDTKYGAVKCYEASDPLDDLIGPMVNHQVVAVGHWRGPKGSQEFYVKDVDSDQELDVDK